MDWVAVICRRVSDFLTDEDGTAGLEFVTTSPLLFGVMIFTAEYGQALRARLVLDSAVQDAARYLARAPIDNLGAPGLPTSVAFYPETLVDAEALIEDRVGGNVNFKATISTSDVSNFRIPYYVIDVQAISAIDMPLLSFFNIFREDPTDNDLKQGPGENGINGPVPLQLKLRSVQLVRWVGGAPPGSADCLLADRYQGLCP